ncbi:MAG: hypothetical protein ACM335_03555, partial [Deltaproteobacteria bacterium]
KERGRRIEEWSVGVMEYWSNGMKKAGVMESWSSGVMVKNKDKVFNQHSTTPALHYSKNEV